MTFSGCPQNRGSALSLFSSAISSLAAVADRRFRTESALQVREVPQSGIWPPLGLIYISGELRRHGYNVEIYDSMSRQDTKELRVLCLCFADSALRWQILVGNSSVRGETSDNLDISWCYTYLVRPRC